VNANIYSISPASFAGSSFNKSAGDYCDGGGAEETHHLLRHFTLTVIILPRHARAKHRESTQKREASFAGKEYGPGYCLEVDWVESNGHCGGAGNASFAPFLYIYDHFTKTGSGQIQGKLKTKTRFPQGHPPCTLCQGEMPAEFRSAATRAAAGWSMYSMRAWCT
jgi:hypothetical protein